MIESSGVDDGLSLGIGAEDDQEVADHGGFALIVQLDHIFDRELFQCHFDHADRTQNNFLSSRDDGFSLLAPKHGAGDLRCIGQVVESSFLDHDTGLVEAFLEFGLERHGDFAGVAAQGDLFLSMLALIIGVRGGQVADGGFALNGYELLVIIDIEHGFGGIFHAPDDDGRNLNRVAALVVDLEFIAIHVA